MKPVPRLQSQLRTNAQSARDAGRTQPLPSLAIPAHASRLSSSTQGKHAAQQIVTEGSPSSSSAFHHRRLCACEKCVLSRALLQRAHPAANRDGDEGVPHQGPVRSRRCAASAAAARCLPAFSNVPQVFHQPKGLSIAANCCRSQWAAPSITTSMLGLWPEPRRPRIRSGLALYPAYADVHFAAQPASSAGAAHPAATNSPQMRAAACVSQHVSHSAMQTMQRSRAALPAWPHCCGPFSKAEPRSRGHARHGAHQHPGAGLQREAVDLGRLHARRAAHLRAPTPQEDIDAHGFMQGSLWQPHISCPQQTPDLCASIAQRRP